MMITLTDAIIDTKIHRTVFKTAFECGILKKYENEKRTFLDEDEVQKKLKLLRTGSSFIRAFQKNNDTVMSVSAAMRKFFIDRNAIKKLINEGKIKIIEKNGDKRTIYIDTSFLIKNWRYR